MTGTNTENTIDALRRIYHSGQAVRVLFVCLGNE